MPNMQKIMYDNFDDDLYQFTGKRQDDYQNIRDKFEQQYGINGLDQYCLRNVDLTNPTHKSLIAAYNDPMYNAYVFSYNSIFPRALPNDYPNLELEPVIGKFLNRPNDFVKGNRLLEYGCGGCNAAFKFWLAGFDLTLCDLPLDWLKFLEWRIKKYAIPRIKFIYIEDNASFLPNNEMYDCFYTHDVFEHVVNPHHALFHMSQHIKPGALVYIELKFHAGGFHLAVNHKKFNLEKDNINNEDGNQVWRDVLNVCGIVPVPINWNYPPYFFRKLWRS